MIWTKRLWGRLTEAVLSPKIDDVELAEQLEAIKPNLPIPVFWLLGKAQSGKTSLIRALTGRTDMEIGNGFQPCTHTARLYDFPSAEQCFIRFLDTRGLGEVDYDPSEDLRLFSQQAHLLIVVVKAMDHAQEEVLQALRLILTAHPHWPVIVAQTTLHEGYPNVQSEHLQPYPYTQRPLPPQVPKNLARSLLRQRGLFADIPAQFVSVDFTAPDDGFVPVNYGLDALWMAIETALPLGLQAMLHGHKQLTNLYARAAHPHIIAYAVLAGSVDMVPLPLVNLPLVLAVQAKLCHAVASIYNQRLERAHLTNLGSALGAGYLARLGGRQLVKIIPAYGTAVSALYSAAVTYALGKVLCLYFGDILKGNVPTEATIAKAYAEELQRGRDLLKNYFQSNAQQR